MRKFWKISRKATFGWCMYDWANSAFATSITVAILPVYFVSLFKDSVGPETIMLGFTFTGSSVWSLSVAISTAIVAITSPALGIIADRKNIRKYLLITYTLVGSIFTVLLFFSVYFENLDWAWMFGCFLIANVGFAGACVFYNSFLPHLGERDEYDQISGRGFSYGYVGGGILLAIHLALIMMFSGTTNEDLVIRLCLASVGLWWFGFAILTFMLVPEPKTEHNNDKISLISAAKIAIAQLKITFSEIKKFRMLAIFLAAYLLFNDGIQTVISISGAFGSDTLGVSLLSNMATILIVQFVAALGSEISWKLSQLFGTKKALVSTLIGWCIVILLAIGFAPLEPKESKDFDYILTSDNNGRYEATKSPELYDSNNDLEWESLFGYYLKDKDSLSERDTELISQAVDISEFSRFTLLIQGGNLDGLTAIGPLHPVNQLKGPLGWWPKFMKNNIWGPLNLSVDMQWLTLGTMVGLVLGGSQSLARSFFSYMTPQSRSGEFFGFFGFVSRTSAVFGPMLYILITGILDTRVAIAAILVLILIGTYLLRYIDSEAGKIAAETEDNTINNNN